jgi:hypothetical protein
MASKDDRPLAEGDAIWDAAIAQALRAVDAHLARVAPPCDRVLTELRFEISLLVRQRVPHGPPN